VIEAREPHRSGEVVNAAVGGVSRDQGQLLAGELLEADAIDDPVGMPAAGRGGLDDDVGYFVFPLVRLSGSEHVVAVDEESADLGDVLARATSEIGCVDGDADAGTGSVEAAKRSPVLLQGAVQHLGKSLVPAIDRRRRFGRRTQLLPAR
jgi:hypothetical protein